MFRFSRHFSPYLAACALLVVGLCAPSVGSADHSGDFQAWQTLSATVHDGPQWRLKLNGQARWADDADFLGARLFFPTAEYKLHPNLDLGGTYLFEDIRSDAHEDYTRLHIFWLYLNPHWQWDGGTRFSMRHVLGLRGVESGADYWISRHQFALQRKFENLGRLVGIGASTELFYHFEEDTLFENRLIPLNLNFRLTDQATLGLYGMFQSKNIGYSGNWETAFVFGQTLSIKF